MPSGTSRARVVITTLRVPRSARFTAATSSSAACRGIVLAVNYASGVVRGLIQVGLRDHISTGLRHLLPNARVHWKR